MITLQASSLTVPAGSPALRGAFVLLAVGVAALFPVAVWWSAIRAALGRSRIARETALAATATILWLVATHAAASFGWLHFSPPPTMMLVFVTVFAIAIGLALSPVGRRIALHVPLAVLVGFQAFRVVVELLLHRAYTEGLMPIQMSYAGRNFDIVSGLTAIPVAVWLAAGGRSARVLLAWNTLSVGLLLNILGIALLSAPTPFRVFMNEPSNVWITQAPWVWLPAMMVLAAVAGHALVYRRLVLDAGARAREDHSAGA
jgi:hypothetical protein